MPKSHFINRKKEIQLFQMILKHEINARVLFISGESGMGKTSLLRALIDICSQEKILLSAYDYRGGLDSPLTQLTKHINDLGISNFDLLRANLEEVGINNSELIKTELYSSTDIQYALTGFDVDNRFSALSIITNSFVTGLQILLKQNQPIIFFLDSTEQTGPITKQWLSKDFLRIVNEAPGVIIVAAGRNVIEPSPEIQNIFTHIDLKGIDLAEWQEYAKQLSIHLPSEYLNGVHDIAKGNPMLMTQLLMALERGKRNE